ncbi:MAG TPA: acyl-CoA dehydrogenase family protein, partial [Chthonomonadales bacterium]|nr:acyl-CoA dehydrogenase family protein [Chthonomonadales bacterium]
RPEAEDASVRYHRAAEEYAIECAIVKVVGSELYSQATDEGIQIHGGYGYTEEFPMARAWRDQRLLRIGEGTNEIVRLSIIRQLLRRAHTGRLDMERAAKTLQERLDKFIGPVADPEVLPDRLKQAGLLLLYHAEHHFGKRLSEEQEIIAAIADIIAGAYVAESAWVRAGKLASRNGSSGLADLARCAAHIYTESVRQKTYWLTESVLVRLFREGADVHALSNRLDSILRSRACDLISLRRKIAIAVLEREAYPW